MALHLKYCLVGHSEGVIDLTGHDEISREFAFCGWISSRWCCHQTLGDHGVLKVMEGALSS
jgi:hypothetical protein